MKNKIITLLLLSTFGYTIEMPPMPPMVAMDKQNYSKNHKQTKRSTPKSCDMVPPMVVFLPPPMQVEVDKCNNQLHIPKKELVEKNLSKALKKKISVKKIEIVEKFNQLYKITYNDGSVILTNKTVDAFIKQ